MSEIGTENELPGGVIPEITGAGRHHRFVFTTLRSSCFLAGACVLRSPLRGIPVLIFICVAQFNLMNEFYAGSMAWTKMIIIPLLIIIIIIILTERKF